MEWSSFICTFWVKPCNLINPWISFNYWNKKQETRHTADHISFATGNWHLWELLVSGAVRHRSRAGRGRDSDTGKSLRPRKEGREGELHLRLFFFGLVDSNFDLRYVFEVWIDGLDIFFRWITDSKHQTKHPQPPLREESCIKPH